MSFLQYRYHVWDNDCNFVTGSKKSFTQVAHAKNWVLYKMSQMYPDKEFGDFSIENHQRWGQCYVARADDVHVTLISVAI